MAHVINITFEELVLINRTRDVVYDYYAGLLVIIKPGWCTVQFLPPISSHVHSAAEAGQFEAVLWQVWLVARPRLSAKQVHPMFMLAACEHPPICPPTDLSILPS